MTTLIQPPRQLAILFGKLVAEWKEATQLLSSTNAIAMHPAYQRIIGIGPQAIPLILEELQQKPDHWFWALQAITGENPVTVSDQGSIPKMTQAWIEWGRNAGWIESEAV